MKFKFGKISDINLQDEKSWRDKIFITLDIDWAPDFVINKVHAVLKKAGIVSTWFVTHNAEAIEELKKDVNIELGIHPNFNPLLQNMSDVFGKDMDEVIEYYLKIVPSAKVVRSHSLTQNSVLLNLLRSKGFTHDCNLFLPFQAELNVKPFKHWNGLTRVAHIWEDDIAPIHEESLKESFKEISKFDGLKVLGFHPIHLYLNSCKLDNYTRIKNDMHNQKLVDENVNTSDSGAMDFLEMFLK